MARVEEVVAAVGAVGTFGELLKRLRRRARLTQQELGAAVGYSHAYIARLESNARLPDTAVVATRFVEALGLQNEPVLATRLLELAAQARIRHQAQPDPATSAAAHPSPETLPTNLLPPPTRLIGREAALAEVADLLARHRLVTLTGSGGVGKTRLAIEVGMSLAGATLAVALGTGAEAAARAAPTFADGIWLVDLAPLADPKLVSQATSSIFKLADSAGRDPLELPLDHLRDKQALLILDNCEHLIQACAELAEALLRGCPGVRLLATSREPLQASAEVLWRVPSLSAPDPARLPPLPEVLDYEAVQMFVERAAATQPGFMLTPENLAVIVQICHRLDGIPLALELAASRLYGLSLPELAARLDDRFHLLTSGRRTALPRHQTLRAALDWSHDLLSAPERVLLRRLSAFAGGWTAEAAESVCADASDVLPLLLSLVSKSLVVADATPRAGHMRYRMLETIRQYAAERLAEAGDDEVASMRARLDDPAIAAAWSEGERMTLEQAVACALEA